MKSICATWRCIRKSDDAQPLDLSAASTRYAYHRPASACSRLRQLSLDRRPPLAGHRCGGDNCAAGDDTRRIRWRPAICASMSDVRILQVRLPGSPAGTAGKAASTGELRPTRLSALSGSEAPVGAAATLHRHLPRPEHRPVWKISAAACRQQDTSSWNSDSTNAAVRFSELFRDPLRCCHCRPPRRHPPTRRLADGRRAPAGRLRRIEDNSAPSASAARRRASAVLDLRADFRDGDAAFANPLLSGRHHGQAWSTVRPIHCRRSGDRPGPPWCTGHPVTFHLEKDSNGVFRWCSIRRTSSSATAKAGRRSINLAAHVRFHGNQLDIESVGDDLLTAGSSGRRPYRQPQPDRPTADQRRLQGPLRNNLRALDDPHCMNDSAISRRSCLAKVTPRSTLGFTVPLLASPREYRGQTGFNDNRLSLPAGTSG